MLALPNFVWTTPKATNNVNGSKQDIYDFGMLESAKLRPGADFAKKGRELFKIGQTTDQKNNHRSGTLGSGPRRLNLQSPLARTTTYTQ